jgi:hypothetical protein
VDSRLHRLELRIDHSAINGKALHHRLSKVEKKETILRLTKSELSRLTLLIMLALVAYIVDRLDPTFSKQLWHVLLGSPL